MTDETFVDILHTLRSALDRAQEEPNAMRSAGDEWEVGQRVQREIERTIRQIAQVRRLVADGQYEDIPA